MPDRHGPKDAGSVFRTSGGYGPLRVSQNSQNPAESQTDRADRMLAGEFPRTRHFCQPELLVSKTVTRHLGVSRVRIPPPPLATGRPCKVPTSPTIADLRRPSPNEGIARRSHAPPRLEAWDGAGGVPADFRQCVYFTSCSMSDPPATSTARTACPLPLA